jgi:DNA-3-methyladenine glycosylase II
MQDLENTLSTASEWLAQKDPVLTKIISQVGPCTFSKKTDYYKTLVHSIIGQQISVKAAQSIAKKFHKLIDNDLEPHIVRDYSIEDLRTAGLSLQKASYILDLSDKFYQNKNVYDHLEQLDNKGVIDHLTEVKGIGEWTAHMFLIFSLGRLDVLPVGDIGFQNAVMKLYGFKSKPDKKQLNKIGKKWIPYRSVAVWYLWESLEL